LLLLQTYFVLKNSISSLALNLLFASANLDGNYRQILPLCQGFKLNAGLNFGKCYQVLKMSTFFIVKTKYYSN
ncbi:hypothetical protein CPG37_12645, partial [Malaciobacter canalis]